MLVRSSQCMFYSLVVPLEGVQTEFLPSGTVQWKLGALLALRQRVVLRLLLHLLLGYRLGLPRDRQFSER